MLVRTGFIDPKDYPFKKFIDDQKHLDNDENRHKIQTVKHKIDEHFNDEAHKYCDKEQLDANGKFRRPKKLTEAEGRGFKSVMEMMEADKKAEEAKKLKEVENQKTEIEQLKEYIKQQNEVLKQIIDKLK